MDNLLLITHLPRIIGIFSQLEEKSGFKLCVVTSLDNVAAEIHQHTPSIIFIQSHLSGFSGDILLMHLKKLMDNRPCRFILLTNEKTMQDIILQFNASIDLALDDATLGDIVMQIVSNQADKPLSPAVITKDDISISDLLDTPLHDTQTMVPHNEATETVAALPAPDTSPEVSLEEQGIVYGPKRKLSVYSEFTSSFDDAVQHIQPDVETVHKQWHEEVEYAETSPGFNRFNIQKTIRWALPLLLAAALITWIQYSCSGNKKVDIVASGTTTDKTTEIAVTDTLQKTTVKAPLAKELYDVPDFISNNASHDKNYSISHPGWVRYKNHKREYKVFREGKKIKAIQIIDRSGKGLADAFIKGVLGKFLPTPVFKTESTEQKNDYAIQRGQFADNLKAVYYRDATSGGKLNAIVITWQ